nr:hypothetical protein [Cupriavidus basilensis]
MEPADGVGWQALQGILEPGIGLDTVQATGTQRRLHRRGGTLATRRVREHKIRSANGNLADGAFEANVVRLQDTAFGVAHERSQCLADGCSKVCLASKPWVMPSSHWWNWDGAVVEPVWSGESGARQEAVAGFTGEQSVLSAQSAPGKVRRKASTSLNWPSSLTLRKPRSGLPASLLADLIDQRFLMNFAP